MTKRLKDHIAGEAESPATTVARLARMEPLEAEGWIRKEAKRLGVPVTMLRKEVDAKRKAEAERKAEKARPAAVQGEEGDEDGPAPVTEDFLALELAAERADQCRFDHSNQQWLVWDGTRWARNNDALVKDWIRDLTRSHAEGRNMRTRERLERSSTVNGVEKLAQSDRRLAIEDRLLDRNPMLLGTPGGTVDLTTGELRPALPEDFITCSTAVAPAPPGADCPRWIAFMRWATAADEDDGELLAWIQSMCGYLLTGLVTEQCLFFLWGAGRNGKGTLLDTITWIMGDYAGSLPMETFAQTYFDRPSYDLMMLRGKRLVRVSETEEGRRWNEARLKQLTGADPVQARNPAQAWVTFLPVHKLVFEGNHKPLLSSVDVALSARFRFAPFRRRIMKGEEDKGLRERLKEEGPAILRWCLDGLGRYLEDGGMPPCRAVDAETEEYLQGQDVVGNWVEECCEVSQGMPGASAEQAAMLWRQGVIRAEESKILYRSWKKYCEEVDERPGSVKRFVQGLVKLGFARDRKSRQRLILGLTVLGEPGVAMAPGDR